MKLFMKPLAIPIKTQRRLKEIAFLSDVTRVAVFTKIED